MTYEPVGQDGFRKAYCHGLEPKDNPVDEVEVSFEDLSYEVALYDEDSEPISEHIQRILMLECDLHEGDGKGRVAYCHAFYIEEEYRYKGIGDAVYTLEEQLFADWGAREIHMHAEQDNKELAFRKFRFRPVCRPEIQKLLERWLRRNQVQLDPGDPWPQDFLNTLGTLPAYKVLKQ